MPSRSPIVAKSSLTPPDSRLSFGTISIDHSITINPIKYIGVASPFYDFKPDGDIIDDDGMPSEPSLPRLSVFRSYFHFMILSFGARMKRSEEPRVWASRDQLCELGIFNRSDLPDIARGMRRLRLFFAVMSTVAVAVSEASRRRRTRLAHRSVRAQLVQMRTAERRRLTLRDRQRNPFAILPSFWSHFWSNFLPHQWQISAQIGSLQ
jgi:hypothetical protein